MCRVLPISSYLSEIAHLNANLSKGTVIFNKLTLLSATVKSYFLQKLKHKTVPIFLFNL